ncbi:hypothetical protein [Flavobacterium sp.]|uniref:hypothetical protein n=1 Tax=Flavobacterium sp. TaxID=239 RepID=UPI0037C0620B
MKKILLILFLCLFGYSLKAQNVYLKVEGTTAFETKKIDSIGYQNRFENAKSIIEETALLSKKLFENGFLESENLGNIKTNDSTFLFQYKLGKRISFLHIYIGKENSELIQENYELKNDVLILPITSVESFMNLQLKKLEQKGYSLANLKLENFRTEDSLLFADLKIKKNSQRILNDIVINGSSKFPESHKRNLMRLYANRTFNQDGLQKVFKEIEEYRFVKQTKYPEILFTQDSTKIYVYLEKAKSNRFDGFIGFSNEEDGKFSFNGYLDILLHNILNSGEQFLIYWKNDGKKQTSFNIGLQVPYLFKSPIGIKAELNIFKKDSTFQNTNTSIDLGYFFNYNSRLYLGYQATESSDIQNVNSSFISDFTNSFVTSQYEFTKFKTDDFLFPEKTVFHFKIGLGKRDSKTDSQNQVFGKMELRHNFYLNAKNVIHLKSQNYLLTSENYIVNELYRFGGINSIRGFNENSLQGNLFTSLLTEYRYVLSPGMYVHSIIDYGYYQDQTNASNDSLIGLGFGFGLLTKNGLFNLIYANGSTNDEAIKLANSIVHISFKSSF